MRVYALYKVYIPYTSSRANSPRTFVVQFKAEQENSPAMRMIMLVALFALAVPASFAHAQDGSQMAHADSMAHAVVINLDDLNWNRMFPDLGEKSSEVSILHQEWETGPLRVAGGRCELRPEELSWLRQL